ncbi:hypothetical protein SAMN02799624_05335 [Paenibacillus sp. UNC496MF]|uniref:hypothetical protein n=1 Tax=Paenibacillus sp. UNC496MF TaxID=1502753 RepID=UPI0008E17E4B|nr:hypothetical protein [Paenibacillus sp. UNC496MF]SFJ64348.1 hypothetical protein SAMN02799624_05335 [Paenibacillus sp. UNC496MF]
MKPNSKLYALTDKEVNQVIAGLTHVVNATDLIAYLRELRDTQDIAMSDKDKVQFVHDHFVAREEAAATRLGMMSINAKAIEPAE